MNPKKNLILLLVLIILGSSYYVYGVKWAAEERAAEERKVKLLKGIDDKALIRIDVTREEEPYQIIRTEKGWRFVKPVDAAVDADEVEKLLEAATKLRERNRIGNVKDRTEFGMDKPGMKIIFGLKDKDDVTVEIGDRTPTREFRYAALAKTPEIFTLQLSDIAEFDKSVFSIRDRSIVPVMPESANKVIVEPRDGGDFTVVRKSKDEWALVKPIQDRADAIDSEGIVSTLRWDKVQRFVDEKPGNLAPYGLEKPSLTVRIFTGDNQKPEDGVILGDRKVEAPEPKSGQKKPKAYYYARRLSGGPVMLINEKTIKDLPKSVFSLRHKTVIDYDVDHVTRLLVESKSQKLDILRKAKKKWDIHVTKADGKEEKLIGRHKHVDDLMWDIKWVNSIDYVDDPGDDLSKYGLVQEGGKGAPLRYTVWLKKKEDAPLEDKSLIIGRFLKEEKRAYGRIEGQKRLFAVKKEDYDKITKTPYFLSERRLLLYAKDDEITEVTARFPNKSFMKLERFGEGWRFLSPEGREAEPGNVNDLVGGLLDFEREGEAKPGEAPDFKDFIVELSGRDIRHGEWGPFRFAAREGSDFLYLREGGKVYRITKKWNEDKLPKSLKDWEKEKETEEGTS
ncbi:MAG: DUF4340 domain-containing protein [Nitrospinae bacterium]|nr:DUF4340 domain-containing protein [Nitrospinota bacterium]